MAELEETQRVEREIAARRPEGMGSLGVRDFLQVGLGLALGLALGH